MKKILILLTLSAAIGTLCPLQLSAQPKIQLVNFASGFDLPLDIQHCGDSRLFVVERKGLIWVLDSLGNRLDTFLNIDPRVNSGQNEQGLLGLAFDPHYAENGYFYVDYTKNGTGDTRVARFSVKPNKPNEADPNSELTIIEQAQPNWNHNGGCLRFGPDGFLYISLGDGGGGGDPQNYGQNKKTLLGKILRIDVRNSSVAQPYAVPSSNPFVGNSDYLPEIWSLGWRNPWRYSFDRLTGDMWVGEVGQNLWEEVDFEAANTPGLNYGWRCYEGTHTYNTSGCQPASNYISPFFEYAHSGANGCSVTGGFIYRGSKYPDLYGYYLFADYCSGRWWYTKRNADGTFTTNILANLGGYEFSSFGEGPDGELYVALLSSGKIQKIKELCSSFQITQNSNQAFSCDNGSDGILSVGSTGGTGSTTYTWSNGVTGALNANLNPGFYAVVATDGNSCVRRDTFEIVKVGPNNPALSASDSTICTDGLVQLIASNLTVSSTLTWYNGANIVATTIASASFATLDITQPGDYSVTINHPLCPASSSIVSIVKIGPDKPTLSASDSVMCANGSVQLTAGNLPVPSTLTWYNEANIVATTNASASTATLDIIQPGDYSVIVNHPICLVASPIVSIVKIGPDNPTLSASASVICPNGLVTLTAGNLPVPSTLTWYNGANVVATTNASASTATLDVTQPGEYSVIINDALCPASSSIVSIVLIGSENPILSASDSVICANGAVILTASNLPVPSTVTWYNGANILATTIASASTATLEITQPGEYSVIINDALCLAPSTIVSIVRIGPDNPILSASDSVICVNGSIHLIASNLPVPSTLSWYNGANIVATTTVSASTSPLIVTEPGNYSVVINDTLCAPSSSVVSIVRIGPDNPNLSASNLVLCPNDSITLTASNLPVPSLLNWYNGTSIIAITAVTTTTETITVTEPGNYTVSILDPLCLTASAIVTITAETPLQPLIASNYDSLYTLSPCAACQWLYQGQPIAGATGAYHIATEEGFYSLQVTTPNGCQYTSNVVNFIKVASKLPASVRRFLLSPNPTERSVLLEMELEKTEIINVSLTDTNQRQIFAKTLDGQKIALPIDLSNLPVGTYFLTVQTEGGSFVRKVVKK